MKNLRLFGLVIALLASLPAVAQNPIDGTWKFNLSDAQFPKKPDVYLLQNGKYQCKTCVPPIDVKADGQDQPVSGHPYLDSVNIKVVDDRTVEEVDKKSGKTVATSKTVVSSDGKTATFEFSDSSNTNADPVTGKGTQTQVAKGPAGSHAISGSWVTSKMETLSDNGLLVTFKVEGDSLSMSNKTGQSYLAKLDGTDAPYKGDPGTTSVSVKNAGKNTMEETDKRDGKVISVARMTVGADGKTMTLKVEDKLHGTHSQFTATKPSAHTDAARPQCLAASLVIATDRTSLVEEAAFAGYQCDYCSLVPCDAATCHLPFRLTQVSVKRYLELMSCPL